MHVILHSIVKEKKKTKISELCGAEKKMNDYTNIVIAWSKGVPVERVYTGFNTWLLHARKINF